MKHIYLSIWLLFLLFFASCSKGDIFTAIEKGKLDRVKTFLKEKPELLTQIDGKNRSLLHAAAVEGQWEIAEFLIAKGAAVDQRDRGLLGNTPLMYACFHGHRDTAALLIAKGAQVNARNRQEPLKAVLSFMEKNDNETAAWLKKYIDQFKEKRGNSPLHLAVASGSKETVALLLEHNAEINAIGEWGHTPLVSAIKKGEKELVDFLLARGAEVNNGTAVNRFWRGYETNWTPLMQAARQGNRDIVRLLVDRGAEINAVSSSGRAALLLAINCGNAAVGRFLISKGADLSVTSGGSTLLHRAAYEGLVEIAQILISRGFDINAVNERNQTPLHMALYHESIDTALLLLKKGARLDIVDKYGETPADIGIRRDFPRIVRFLLPLHRAVERGDVKDVERLTADSPQLIDVRDDLGWTPLHHAVINNRLDIAEVLLEKGAGLNIKSKHRSIDTLRGVVGKLLVPKSSRVKLFQDKRTPIEVAAQLGNREMVEVFKRFGTQEK